MTQYLVSIYHADDYDPAKEPAEMHRDIDTLNDEMVAAGVRVFVGGLAPARTAKSVRRKGAKLVLTDGPYIETREHIGGFWVLECATLEEAIAWGEKAAAACRTPVQIRAFN
ncbi:MAG: YciI family protein [Dehalococcoidia bacterium]